MSVYLDGATLSALLFSFLNSNGSQYGFLIGERIEHIEDSISDSQILTYNVNSYIYISSFLPWPSEESIYSREGHFREEWIKRCMPKSEHTLVGWYSFRHNTSARPSLREITLHSSLTTSEAIAAQANELLFFLCTSAFSSNMSTHTCSHGFLRSIDGHFVPVPMSVMNLGDTTRKEYKKRSSVALSHCKTVQESFHSFKKGFLKSSGESEQITKMSHLATSINKTLMSIHHRVFESEAVLGLLETDVSILRQRLGRFEQEETKTAQIEAEKRHHERDEAKRTKSAGELGLTQTDVSVFRQRVGRLEQEKIKTAQIEAERRHHERDEAKRTKSAGELGLTQTDVSVLRQRLGWFEQEEIKTAQIEAEKRHHERDEARRKKSEAEEQDQLKKLLIDLGIWPSDNCVGASDIGQCVHHTAPFPVEHYFNNEDEFASYQVVNLVPSVSTMQAFGNSSSGRNQECLARNISLMKQAVGEQRVATRVQDKPCEIKKPQTVKDKVSEAFSFLDEELQWKKVGASSQRQVECLQTNRCTGTGRVYNKAGENEHRVCIRELSRNTDNPGVSDSRKDKAMVVNNYSQPLVKVLNDNVNATSSNMRVGESSGIPY